MREDLSIRDQDGSGLPWDYVRGFDKSFMPDPCAENWLHWKAHATMVWKIVLDEAG